MNTENSLSTTAIVFIVVTTTLGQSDATGNFHPYIKDAGTAEEIIDSQAFQRSETAIGGADSFDKAEGELSSYRGLEDKIIRDVDSFDKAEGELSSYLSLEKDWDGYDGTPPDRETIVSTIKFLHDLKSKNIQPPKPMLSGSGEVGLYWKADDHYIEVGFEDEKLYSYLIKTPKSFFGEDDVEFLDGKISKQLLIELSSLRNTKLKHPEEFLTSY